MIDPLGLLPRVSLPQWAPENRPTFGGLQFWADVQLWRDWRIQLNVDRGVYRLIDGWYFQHAQGSLERCRQILAEVKEPFDPEAGGADRVLLLHGLIRTRHSMDTLAYHLRSHGFECYTVSYPSTRLSMRAHADHLSQIVENLDGDRPIHFVGHSMGGLIARIYLEEHSDPRLKRIVTIGTPHHGAEKAILFNRVGLLPVVGPAAQELLPGGEGIFPELTPNPTARCGVEIGVIAAGGPGGKGYSVVVPPDNDGVVTVASTMLDGAADFQLVRGHHTFLPSLLSVRQATERFLRHGYFRTEADRQPIRMSKAEAKTALPLTA